MTDRGCCCVVGFIVGLCVMTIVGLALLPGCRLWDLLPDRNPPETDSGWQLDWDIEDLSEGEINFED